MTQAEGPLLGSNLPELSVSEVSQAIRNTVESHFDRVRLRGEVSRPTYARSGHLYLTLKDDRAVIDAVAWKGTVSRLALRAEEGMEVIVEGRITTYPGSSKYQIVFDRMELAGEGALLKLLEDRKRRLQAEGLFDPARKRPLPFLPGLIGVVTSPTGAVLRDIMHRLGDRFPSRVLLWPVQVQGQGAAEQVAAAIKGFNLLDPLLRPDLLIVARGGGSLEDLWTFNEEIVVRTAADSLIPLISAVGHETDHTLIDLAADVRAPTPSAAAEMAVPVLADLRGFLHDQQGRLRAATLRRVAEKALALDALARGLIHPARRLEDLSQTLDGWGQRLDQAVRARADRAVTQLDALDPQQRLPRALQQLLARRRDLLDSWSARLDAAQAIETLALKRGYARLRDANGRLITSATAVPDQPIEVQLHDGSLWMQRLPAPNGSDPGGGKPGPRPPSGQRRAAVREAVTDQGDLF